MFLILEPLSLPHIYERLPYVHCVHFLKRWKIVYMHISCLFFKFVIIYCVIYVLFIVSHLRFVKQRIHYSDSSWTSFFFLMWSGIQIGNWSRWLTDLFGIEDDDSIENMNNENGNDIEVEVERKELDTSFKAFHLLNALSDLMMLPKDMLLSRSIRKEVFILKLFSLPFQSFFCFDPRILFLSPVLKVFHISRYVLHLVHH